MPLLKKLLEIEPMNEEVLITLGAVYSQMSEHKLSIDCFKRALVFADKEAKREIRIDIALEYENMGAWQKAIRNLHEALEEDTLNETPFTNWPSTSEQDNSNRRRRSTSNSGKAAVFVCRLVRYKCTSAMRTLHPAIDAYDFAIAIKRIQSPTIRKRSLGRSGAVPRRTAHLRNTDSLPQPRCYMGEYLSVSG